MQAGVYVLGMHRSGTSLATRLISNLGVEAPRGDDLVPPSKKNAKGYWESLSLVATNIRILTAIGSDFSCPVAWEPGWETDARLDDLRIEALDTFRRAYPRGPWVWKDPRTCLTFAFWRCLLDEQPFVVLVNRNPLEIVASSARTTGQEERVYVLALWERYLRQALAQIEGLPVVVVDHSDVLSSPLAYCEQIHAFLSRGGVALQRPRESDVLSFVDADLRHAEFSRTDFLDADDVSEAQRQLFVALENLRGNHDEFVPPLLPIETPATEVLLAGRRRSRQELTRLLEVERRLSTGAAAPAVRVYAGVRRLLRNDKAV